MYKKITISILSSILMLLTFAPVAFAEENNNISHSKENISSESVNYYFEGSSVIEQATFEVHGDTVSIVRKINPDNTYQMAINDYNGVKLTTGTTDYNLFKQITHYYLNNGELPTFNSNSRGSDITGSNFRHVYVATTGPHTYYRGDFTISMGVNGIVTAIIGEFYNIPHSTLLSIAQTLLGMINPDPYKTVINSTTYEVRFSYDDVYYTHCYHLTINTYDDQLHHIETKKDYYQSIGG